MGSIPLRTLLCPLPVWSRSAKVVQRDPRGSSPLPIPKQDRSVSTAACLFSGLEKSLLFCSCNHFHFSIISEGSGQQYLYTGILLIKDQSKTVKEGSLQQSFSASLFNMAVKFENLFFSPFNVITGEMRAKLYVTEIMLIYCYPSHTVLRIERRYD